MKTVKLKTELILAAIFFFSSVLAFTQEKDKTKVHLKVKKDEVVTLDTTFYIKSGSESDELKNLISEFAEIEDLDLYRIDEHGHFYLDSGMKKVDSDSIKTIVLTVDDDEFMDIEIEEEDGKYVTVKRKIRSGTGEKAVAYSYSKGGSVLISKGVAVVIDTLDTGDEECTKQIRITIDSGSTGSDHVWVSGSGDHDHHIIVKPGKDDKKIFTIVSGK
ncbi:MAG: hypothetical protein JSV24_00005, partial [Bacteroidales bacterium]